MFKQAAWWLDVILAVVLIAAALAVRIPIALERKILPAGDVFNLQHIAENIPHFVYPHQENRLPGFPVLILLTRPLPVDPVTATIGISVTLSSLLLATLYGLGRLLRIHRIPLFTVLALSIFDPLLTVGAVRPLSDATFLFFLTLYIFLITRQLVSKPSSLRALLGIGIVTTFMIFTRFEGVAVAALTLPLLWLKLPWRKVATAISIPFIAGLMWIPIHVHIHGSLVGGYLNAFTDPSGDFGNIHAVPSKILIMVKSAGWGNAWTLPAYEIDQDPKSEAVNRLITQPSWWISILALLGMPWLFVTVRKAALPLLLAVAGYICILSLWFLYSRFVTPLVPIFYLTAAAGGSALFYVMKRQKLAGFGVIIISVFFAWILWTQALPMHKQALGRAWESNQKGYALFTAIRETAKHDELTATAYWTEGHTFATLYFKGEGFFPSRYPEETPEQLYERMRERKVKHIIQTSDDARLPALRELLTQRGNITSTTTYRSFIWADNSFETTDVDHLVWP